MPKFRMIHVDHYMCRPTVPFDDLKSEISGKPISKVPVIRIFGVDVRGRKICIHVHGFYPYVAIQNKAPNDENITKRIVGDIEKGLAELVEENRRNINPPRQKEGGQTDGLRVNDLASCERSVENPSNEEDQLALRIQQERKPILYLSGDQKSPIHRIEPIVTFNYYGYHNKTENFFKLYLYNPKMVKQLALIFENGRVLSRFIPVFWAHLPYILLFFIDNNLRGMQFIEVDHLYWRRDKEPKEKESNIFDGVNLRAGPSDSNRAFNATSDLDEEQPVSDIEAMTTCELEADVRYEWIVNRQKFGSKGNDDALRELWLDDQEASQGSKVTDPELPLYDLERNYIQQLCEAYDLNHEMISLEITERPKKIDDEDADLFSDTDDSLELKDVEDREPPTEPSNRPSTSNIDMNNSYDEDEFSDDEEFVRNLPHIISKIYNSDNSIIDGRSVVCSTVKSSSRFGSQTSSKETISHEYQYLSLMSMEVHVTTRDKLRPDPAFDPIEAVFYCIRNDVPETSDKPVQVIGLIFTDPFRDKNFARSSLPNTARSPDAFSTSSFSRDIRTLLQRSGLSLDTMELNVVDTELELIMKLVDIVRTLDPEILLGYEMEQLSWGYILERSNILGINISSSLSRVSDSSASNNSKYVESNFVQPIMFTGRMVFSVWRIIKHEINLNTCSYERIHHHALGERVPCFAFETLSMWFNQNHNRWRVIDYYLIRVVGQLRILDKFDLIAKISELARVYGTQFIDVITRGSQIGIESMMLRLAKLQNLTPLSPTVMQRNKMKAPEALPLVMEPETNIYYDPVAVLDFQSLYPSVVIAYNYCYSTCLGRVTDLEKQERHQFGCSHLNVEVEEMKRLLKGNSVHVSPCGVAFVKKNVRHGVLPKMLNELILTRAMVKDQMKKNIKSERPNRRLQRILDHRQHGLKMMANTTYGYTGASYTGRMPCVEIADSIVSKGRETLENAIEIVESRAEWGAKVIYGDTDSIFIQFQNCDKESAFKRAYEMVDAITAANPHPIKMKFEKIYQPCVLQTKKRYCGFKYEFPEQNKPDFEAKGIETVRRDCCVAAARMLEMALRIQFTTRDINQVKKYVQNQFIKIMSGKLSNLQDFIFARQYKPRDLEKTESVFVPAWQITKRLLANDPRAEPRLNERVPFVIIYGEPKTPLVNLAKTPIEVLENLSYRINADYYIQKIICPTLNRVFCTMRVDTLVWYKSMPHRNLLHRSHYLIAQKNPTTIGSTKQSTMSQYFSPAHCPVCAKSLPINDDICDVCRENMQASIVRLTEEITRNQRKLFISHQLCRACSSLERPDIGVQGEHYNPCISYDCQNLFRYHQAKLDALNSNFLSQVLKNLN